MSTLKSRALVVDDDPLFRTLLDRHFAAEGWEVVSAEGLVNGLRAYAEAPFDLVVVDYLLRDGNGHNFVQGVRETDLDVPILVVSGAFDLEALAGRRVRGVGERILGERLLDLDGLAGVDELVDVRGHVGSAGVLAVELFEC